MRKSNAHVGHGDMVLSVLWSIEEDGVTSSLHDCRRRITEEL